SADSLHGVTWRRARQRARRRAVSASAHSDSDDTSWPGETDGAGTRATTRPPIVNRLTNRLPSWKATSASGIALRRALGRASVSETALAALAAAAHCLRMEGRIQFFPPSSRTPHQTLRPSSSAPGLERAGTVRRVTRLRRPSVQRQRRLLSAGRDANQVQDGREHWLQRRQSTSSVPKNASRHESK